MRKTPCILVIIAFLANTFGPVPLAQGQEFHLPTPGVMVHLSPPLEPPMLKGLKVHPDNPFRFDFILDKGDIELDNDQVKDESSKLIKYFLASLTIPEKNLWVNLSPYEKDRIVPQSFGLTEMGRDLLAEDYLLKQVTASLIYPEGETGKKFWKRIYAEAAKKFGTTNIPVNTFNKVWIVPDKAVVYENAKAGTAYVVESKLKVMLEQDYLSMQKHSDVGVTEGGASPAARNEVRTDGETRGQDPNINRLGSQIIREIVIPELTKEVNEDKNFSRLRQVYNSLILATWYKKKIKDSILEQVYADKNKINGLSYPAKGDVEAIYQRYLKAFKKGVFNYIKEESDVMTQEIIPRKYFSGGANFTALALDHAMSVTTDKAIVEGKEGLVVVEAGLNISLGDKAMSAAENTEKVVNLQEGRQLTEEILNEFNSQIDPLSADRSKHFDGIIHVIYTPILIVYNTLKEAMSSQRIDDVQKEKIKEALSTLSYYLDRYSDFNNFDKVKEWSQEFIKNYKKLSYTEQFRFLTIYELAIFSNGQGFTQETADRIKAVKDVYDRNAGAIRRILNEGDQAMKVMDLAHPSLDGQPFSGFVGWMNNIADATTSPLSDDELNSLADQLSVKGEDLRAKAVSVAQASHAFYKQLPKDGKTNVYLFRDAFGLYTAERTAGGKPLAMLVSKALVQKASGASIDLVVLGIINQAKSNLHLDLNSPVEKKDFGKFKTEFFRLFDALINGKEVGEVDTANKLILQRASNLRTVTDYLSAYSRQIGITPDLIRNNGVRFIDTTMRGTFVLLMEAVAREMMKNVGMTDAEMEGKTDSQMFYSSLSREMSFIKDQSNPRATELFGYPVEFKSVNSVSPSIPSVKAAPSEINNFLFLTTALKSELLKADAAMGTKVDVAGVKDWVLNGSIDDIQPDIVRYKDLKGQPVEAIEGLKNKVVIRLKDGRTIFIADNHNHAFSFWWLMMKEGQLKGSGNKILHIDAHADARMRTKYGSDVDDIFKGNNLSDTDELSNNLGIEGFIAPLAESGFISDWHWLYNLHGGMAARMEKKTESQYEISDSKANPGELKYDILDVDIDVLNQGFTEEESQPYLRSFAEMAKKAKVISIVTSPEFIDQYQALRYIKTLVADIVAQDSKGSADAAMAADLRREVDSVSGLARTRMPKQIELPYPSTTYNWNHLLAAAVYRNDFKVCVVPVIEEDSLQGKIQKELLKRAQEKGLEVKNIVDGQGLSPQNEIVVGEAGSVDNVVKVYQSSQEKSTGYEFYLHLGMALGYPLAAIHRHYTRIVYYKLKSYHDETKYKERNNLQFYVSRHSEFPDIVEKVAMRQDVNESVALAQERLGGMAADFTVIDNDGHLVILQRWVENNLNDRLQEAMAEGKLDDVKSLFDKFFAFNLEMLKRGVFNWDLKLVNYGLDQEGRIFLLDIGGLLDINKAEDRITAAGILLSKDIPEQIKELFAQKAREYGFFDEASIRNKIEEAKHSQELVKIPVKSDELLTEIDDRVYNIKHSDDAMLSPKGPIKQVAAKDLGGIDLTPANMNLQINQAMDSMQGIKFHLNPAMLTQLQNATGFVPVIISVKPLADLQRFLGIVNQTQ